MSKSVLTDDQKNRVYELSGDGFSQTKIAALYGVSQATISNVIKEKRFENEIRKRDIMMQNAMAYGARSAVQNYIDYNESTDGYLEG